MRLTHLKTIAASMWRSSGAKWIRRASLVLAVWFLIHSVVISIDGFSDQLPRSEPMDVAVVLGNAINPDGMPGTVLTARLEKALEIYRIGAARRIVCSGGQGETDHWEGDGMRDWLIARGVPTDKIVVDNGGVDSYHTALNTKKLIDANGWNSVIIVTHVSHISRCKLAFRQFGVQYLGQAHAAISLGDLKGYPHEFFGYYYYILRRYGTPQP